MKKRIVIKGDFEMEGDIPCLEMTTGRFTFVELELEYNPVVRMVQMTGKFKTTPCHGKVKG